MRSAPLLLTIAFAACVLSAPMTSRAADLQPSRSGAVEIHWVVQRGNASPGNASARQLKMRIPRDYVQNIHRDPRGASEKGSGVTNNGISTVSVEALLPNLSPRLPAFETKQGTPEERREFFNRQLIVEIKASFRAGGRATRDSFASQARRGMFYRLSDLHGLERFRRMSCGASSDFDAAKADVPRPEPPRGCRPLAADEYLIGPDADPVAVICEEPSGRCSMETWFQGFWSVEVNFPRSRLASWRNMRKQVVELLSSFVVG
jgi:hypothetical protein